MLFIKPRFEFANFCKLFDVEIFIFISPEVGIIPILNVYEIHLKVDDNM